LRYAGCGMRFALSVISVGGVISGSCLAFMDAVECVGVRSDRTCPLSGRSGNIRLNGLLVGVKAPSLSQSVPSDRSGTCRSTATVRPLFLPPAERPESPSSINGHRHERWERSFRPTAPAFVRSRNVRMQELLGRSERSCCIRVYGASNGPRMTHLSDGMFVRNGPLQATCTHPPLV
jgi:hypothetical protein